MPRKNADRIFGSYFSECPFCSNGTCTIKGMITSEDQRKNFACALQNACPVIIEKY